MVERVMNERENRKRWALRIALGAVATAAVVAVFGSRFYQTVQAPYRTALAEAEREAAERLRLEHVTSVERFVGDRPYSVVFATYGDEDVVVWMWDEGTHMERLADGTTREEIKAIALAEQPAKRLLRIAPGRLNGAFVWEVFYSLEEEGGTRKYYDYYAFADGRKLETYRLALERR